MLLCCLCLLLLSGLSASIASFGIVAPFDLTVKYLPDFLCSLFKLGDCGSMRKAGNQESSVVSFHKCESDLMFGANRFPNQPEQMR